MSSDIRWGTWGPMVMVSWSVMMLGGWGMLPTPHNFMMSFMILLWLLCCVHLILMAVKMRKTFLDQPQHLIGYGISISCPSCVTDLWSGPSGKCPQIKHSNVSSAESQQPFIASDCSHFQFSQNWFGAICALQGAFCAQWKLIHGKNEKLRSQKRGKCTSWSR